VNPYPRSGVGVAGEWTNFMRSMSRDPILESIRFEDSTDSVALGDPTAVSAQVSTSTVSVTFFLFSKTSFS